MSTNVTAPALTDVFLGLGLYSRPVYWSLKYPHMGLSMITGMGKSTFCRGIACQFIHHGCRVVIIDVAKAGDSHGDWVLDDNGLLIPGVELAVTTAEAHELLIGWEAERLRRSNASFKRTGETVQRTLVIIEEANITISLLRNYWRSIKQTGDPFISPAVDAVMGLTCAGRSTQIHVILVAQKLSSQAAGGEAIRENLDNKVLAGCSERTWKNLLPQHSFPKRGMSELPGAAMLALGTQLTEFHIPNLPPRDAQQHALDGYPQPAGAGLRPVARESASHVIDDSTKSPHAADSVPCPRVQQTLEVPSVDQFPGPLTLTDAAKGGLLGGWTAAALKQHRRRKPDDFPAPLDTSGKAWVYDAMDLWSWYLTHRKDK